MNRVGIGNNVSAIAIAADDDSTYVTKTTEILHVYANGTEGSDSNSGYSEDDAKKTLAAVLDLVPDRMDHHVVVHLRGTFTEGGNINVESGKSNSLTRFIIEGGDEVVVLSGPHTSTAGETSIAAIGTSGLGLTPDQYAGYWLEILDGTYVERRYLITAHSADVITPVRNFPGDPGAGVSYRIVRPATTIDGSSNSWALRQQNNSLWYTHLQNLFITGTVYLWVGGFAGVAFHGVIWNGSTISPIAAPMSFGNGFVFDSSDPDIYDTTKIVTFSQLSGLLLLNTIPGWAILPLCYLTDVEIHNSATTIYGGTRVNGSMVLFDCFSPRGQSIYNSSNYPATKFTNPAGVGLSLNGGSDIAVGPGVDFSDSSSHAIEVDRSRLRLIGAAVGTGNSGAGCYAHAGSFVTFPDGSAPTISGTVGDTSVDGTTQASTWAAIDGGTPVVDATEQTTIKELI